MQLAVAQTIDALDLTEKDAGAVKLAMEYAQTIDAGAADLLDKLGPKLLACLESLGATPAARARMKTAKPAEPRPNRLAELRAAANR